MRTARDSMGMAAAGAVLGALALSACGSAGGSTEGTASSAAPAQAGADGTDGGVDCAALIAQMLAAPIRPPGSFLGLQLAQSLAEDGGLGTGGLSIEKSGLLACAQYAEPADPPGGPLNPGLRTVALAATYAGRSKTLDAADPILVTYNVESKTIAQVQLSGTSYTGPLLFSSRAGGAYGSHTYLLGLTPEPNGSTAGYVERDGVDFPADWTTTAWANEIYDGLLATYAPDQAPAPTGDCTTSTFVTDMLGVPTTQAECLYAPNEDGYAYLGVRPLGFYMVFLAGTNRAQIVYEDWLGGFPSCATPVAALERMDWSPVGLGEMGGAIGPTLGHLQPDGVYSNPSGMLYSEANTMEGCGGQAVTAPDRGYEAAQWGASGEVEMEYDRATGVAYKVWVKAGYLGSMSFMGPTSSGTASYVITPTSLTLDGEPVAFDWTSLEAVTPTVTAISNAWINYELGAAADKDCRASGDCEVVLDDGHGHSTFTLQPSATTAGGSYPGITVVFAQGSSTPVEIETVNPGGKK